MNTFLARWNAFKLDEAVRSILPCSGSKAWATQMTSRRPFANEEEVYFAADTVWWGLAETDWQEAFDSHPRIGEEGAKKLATDESLQWSAQEQQTAMRADDKAKQWLAKSNRMYEAKFGRIFIVCATGKSAAEILAILESRMNNNPATELREAAEQQRLITRLRLSRWLEGR